MQVLRASLVMVAGFLLPWLIQRADRDRLDEQQRTRTWNFSSWGSAVYAFGPLSMLGWCWTTRRPWIRCLVGSIYTSLTLGAIVLFDGALGWMTSHAEQASLLSFFTEFGVAMAITALASFLFLLTLETFAAIRRTIR